MQFIHTHNIVLWYKTLGLMERKKPVVQDTGDSTKLVAAQIYLF